MVALLVALVAGCGGGGGSGTSKTYELDGRKISFQIPPAPWVEKVLEEEPPPEGDGRMTDKPTPTPVGVAFARETGKGSFSVGLMDQNVDVKYDPKNPKKVLSRTPVELENDQVTLDWIAMWVEKRDGKRLKQEYIKVAGVNAFHMVFEIGRPEERMKGEQVHFTKNGTHYILSMVMPVADYDSQVGYFQNMVSSFQILQGKPLQGVTGKTAGVATP
jgi:hypothetical protein